jgi:hypothetical protein
MFSCLDIFSAFIAYQSAVSSPLLATAVELSRSLSSIEEHLIAHSSPIPNPGEVDLLRVPAHSTNTAHTLENATGTTVPQPLMVGSANYAQELDPNSRTIAVNGTHIASVVIGDDVPLKKVVHVPARIYHRSFLAHARHVSELTRLVNERQAQLEFDSSGCPPTRVDSS